MKSYSNDKVSVFLPLRKGSERVSNKNTKKFGPYKFGLLELKLDQLLKSSRVSEIVVSTNDDNVINFINSKNLPVNLDIRPDFLCLSSTKLDDLIEYVPSVCSYENILWTHVTSPFVNDQDYDEAILKYFECLNDSLMSVTPIMNYLYSSKLKKNINVTDGLNWPRTQDIEPVYEINNAIFIYNKQGYVNDKNRIGKNPYLFEMNKYKSLDMDWEEDFLVGELLYGKI